MDNKTSTQDTQSLLSIGYVYLIFLGILNETLFYNQLGIEILKYSSILDVLISPISNLTSGAALFFLILLVLSIFFLPAYLAKLRDKKWVQSSFKIDPKHNAEEVTVHLFRFLVVMAAFGLFGLFVGRGAAGGLRMAKSIKNETLAYNDKLTFLNGEIENVEVLGKNSTYLFYVTPGNTSVQVSPIGGTIKSIEERD